MTASVGYHNVLYLELRCLFIKFYTALKYICLYLSLILWNEQKLYFICRWSWLNFLLNIVYTNESLWVLRCSVVKSFTGQVVNCPATWVWDGCEGWFKLRANLVRNFEGPDQTKNNVFFFYFWVLFVLIVLFFSPIKFSCVLYPKCYICCNFKIHLDTCTL